MQHRSHEPAAKRPEKVCSWHDPLVLLACLLAVVGLLRPITSSCDAYPRPAHAAEAAHGTVLSSESAGVLGDLYAWENDDGRLVLVLTYAQGIEAGGEPIYDADLLYSIWIHHGPDWELPDQVIGIRFGQNENGEWGVQIRHVPGAGEDLVGPVEETIEAGTARAWVGLRDDPFFFDAVGLQDVLESVANEETLSALPFDAARDGFAGTNAMAIVIELDMPEQEVGFYASVGRSRR
jgi:hypothetical protein